VPFAAVREVARIIEPITVGKPVMDVTNVLTKDAGLAIGFTTSGGEELQKKLPAGCFVMASFFIRWHRDSWLERQRHLARLWNVAVGQRVTGSRPEAPRSRQAWT
jgi:hypothetical protein